jgi:GNAT superfamily N-acetyltransferase
MLKKLLGLALLTTHLVAIEYSITVDANNPQIAGKILDGLENFNIVFFKEFDGKDRKLQPFVIYAADSDGTHIGGLCGGIFGTWAYVDYASVEPAWQNMGVGTQLFMKLEEHLKSHNCEYVQLFTWEYQAVGFYEKLGYTCVGTIPNWIENTYDAYFFKKQL